MLMDVIEILIFLGIAVIVGGMFIGFLIDWDFKKTQEELSNLMKDKQELKFEKVSKEGFISNLYQLWDECAYGEINKTLTLYIETQTENDKLEKSFIFDQLKKINYCKTLQSTEFDCGQREDLQMSDITLPNVVTIKCTHTGLEVYS